LRGGGLQGDSRKCKPETLRTENERNSKDFTGKLVSYLLRSGRTEAFHWEAYMMHHDRVDSQLKIIKGKRQSSLDRKKRNHAGASNSGLEQRRRGGTTSQQALLGTKGLRQRQITHKEIWNSKGQPEEKTTGESVGGEGEETEQPV